MHQHLPAPVPLLGALAPPYDRIVPLPAEGGGSAALPWGTVLALRLCPDGGWPATAAALPAIRARYPAACLVLLLDRLTPEAILFAPHALRLGVRAIVTADAPLSPQLAAVLPRPVGLGADVLEWLALRGMPLNAVLSRIVAGIFDRAGVQSRVSRLLAEMAETEITVRHRFRKRGVASPVHWLRAARGLHAGLHLQAEPRRPLHALALEMGFADHSALSQLLWRAFRLRPAGVRGTLGWEWMLDRAYPVLAGSQRRDRIDKQGPRRTLTG